MTLSASSRYHPSGEWRASSLTIVTVLRASAFQHRGLVNTLPAVKAFMSVPCSEGLICMIPAVDRGGSCSLLKSLVNASEGKGLEQARLQIPACSSEPGPRPDLDLKVPSCGHAVSAFFCLFSASVSGGLVNEI